MVSSYKLRDGSPELTGEICDIKRRRQKLGYQMQSLNRHKGKIMRGRVGKIRWTLLPLMIALVMSFQIVPGVMERGSGTSEISAQAVGICDRTPAIVTVILREIPDVNDCQLVTEEHLASVRPRSLLLQFLPDLQVGDLDGLVNVTNLSILFSSNLTAYPSGVFRDLRSIEKITMNSNEFGGRSHPRPLRRGLFEALPNLQEIIITVDNIPEIEAGAFTDLPQLRSVTLASVRLKAIDPAAFSNTPNLENLYLQQNEFEELPLLTFGSLPKLKEFSVTGNRSSGIRIAAIPEGYLDEATSLTSVNFSLQGLRGLPGDLFANLPDLEEVNLSSNNIVRLPAELFERSNRLKTLRLHRNQIIELPDGIFDGLTNLTTLWLQQNLIPELPDGIFDDLRNLEELNIRCNPVTPSLDEEYLRSIIPSRKLDNIDYGQHGQSCPEIPDPLIPALPNSTARVLRIEPEIRGVNVSLGEEVRLGVNFYGRQDLIGNELANTVALSWDDGGAGGSFSVDGRIATYTPPSTPGQYVVTARVRPSMCFGNAEQCRATFDVRVTERSSTIVDPVAPENPPGPIPEILSDEAGTAYEVATPIEGATFNGDGFSLHVPPGSVPNGEFIGVNVQRGESASNVGQTHHRYTLAGSFYSVSSVDASGSALNAYRLNSPAEVCIPLPAEIRGDIDSLAIVASNDDKQTVLTTRTKLRETGDLQLCGDFSDLPIRVAASRFGAPPEIPDETEPALDEPTTPATGGLAMPRWYAVLVLLLGIATTATAIAVSVRKRRIEFRGIVSRR